MTERRCKNAAGVHVFTPGFYGENSGALEVRSNLTEKFSGLHRSPAIYHEKFWGGKMVRKTLSVLKLVLPTVGETFFRREPVAPTVGKTSSRRELVAPTVGKTLSRREPVAPTVGKTPSRREPVAPTVGKTLSRRERVAPTVGKTLSRRERVAPTVGKTSSRREPVTPTVGKRHSRKNSDAPTGRLEPSTVRRGSPNVLIARGLLAHRTSTSLVSLNAHGLECMERFSSGQPDTRICEQGVLVASFFVCSGSATGNFIL